MQLPWLNGWIRWSSYSFLQVNDSKFDTKIYPICNKWPIIMQYHSTELVILLPFCAVWIPFFHSNKKYIYFVESIKYLKSLVGIFKSCQKFWHWGYSFLRSWGQILNITFIHFYFINYKQMHLVKTFDFKFICVTITS